MNQLFVVSGMPGLIAVCAAMDAGLFPTAARRTLLVSDEAPIPELAPGLRTVPGFGALAGRFEEVCSWNELIAPLHPAGWSPRTDDLPLLDRWLRRDLGLSGGEPVHLVLGSLAGGPGRALASVLRDGPVTFCVPDLTVYGPSRSTPPGGVSSRIDRLVHLDLVPGLPPLLLSEYGMPVAAVPAECLQTVLAKLGTEVGSPSPAGGTALLLGHPQAVGEEDTHGPLLRGVAARGHATVAFLPHPDTGAVVIDALRRQAGDLGVRLEAPDPRVPAEVWAAALRPALVVGRESAALLVAARHLGLTAAGAGTRTLIDGLVPYDHEARVPAVLVEALLPVLSPEGELSRPLLGPADVRTELSPLLTAMAYCMRPGILPGLRKAAADYLEGHRSSPNMRYFHRRHLRALALPGEKNGCP